MTVWRDAKTVGERPGENLAVSKETEIVRLRTDLRTRRRRFRRRHPRKIVVDDNVNRQKKTASEEEARVEKAGCGEARGAGAESPAQKPKQ